MDELLTALQETEQLEKQYERYEAWQHTAYLCALIANLVPHKGRALRVDDFIPVPYPGRPQMSGKPQTVEQMQETMRSFAAAMNQGRG